MSQNYITFTKVFIKENIISLVEKNQEFRRESISNEKLQKFSFKTDISKFETSFNTYNFVSTNIYIYDNFAFVNATFEYDENELEQFGKNVFRICHEKETFPANELIKELILGLGKNENLLFIRPSGSEIIVKRFSSFDEYSDYCSENKRGTETYSYVYYTYDKQGELSENDLLCLANATEGNSKDAPHKTKSSFTEIDKNFSLQVTNIGCGIKKSSDEKVSEQYPEEFYYKFLEVLRELIYFEYKAKEFNSILDNNSYKNLDDININIRRDMRKAVHLRYDIKNTKKKNNREDIFFGACLSAIDFESLLDEFIEICHSIEKEIRAEIDKREEEHDKHFDKILSVVAVFAIISVFKDGSDLILNMIDAVKEKTFNLSGILSIMAPILCTFSILIILKMFKKK